VHFNPVFLSVFIRDYHLLSVSIRVCHQSRMLRPPREPQTASASWDVRRLTPHDWSARFSLVTSYPFARARFTSD